MKIIITSFMILASAMMSIAQSAEQIINDYIEAVGGKKWDKVNGVKINATSELNGIQVPYETVVLRDGKMYKKHTIFGKDAMMMAYDGTTLWDENLMTNEPKKYDSETTENYKRTIGEFPNPLASYKSLGYSVALDGEEKVDGIECYKIMLTKKPLLIEGLDIPNINYFFIDKNSKLLLMIEFEVLNGEAKGEIVQTKFSNYREIDGVLVAYSMSSGLKGHDQNNEFHNFKKIELNPTVNTDIFKYKGK